MRGGDFMSSQFSLSPDNIDLGPGAGMSGNSLGVQMAAGMSGGRRRRRGTRRMGSKRRGGMRYGGARRRTRRMRKSRKSRR